MSELNYVLDLYREEERLNRPVMSVKKSNKTIELPVYSPIKVNMFHGEPARAPKGEITRIINKINEKEAKDKALVILDKREYSINIISATKKDNIKTIIFLSENLLWHWKTNEELKCGDDVPSDINKGTILNNLLSEMLNYKFIDCGV